MNGYDLKLQASDQKLNLAVHIQTCENPKAVVILAHGMCEHKERYYPFLDYLNENKLNCIIYDHRGHGDSILQSEDLGYFYDNSGNAIVEDLKQIIQYAKQSFPTLPCILFSHSMGTLVSQCYLQENNNQIDAFISCGQPCKNPLSLPGLYLSKWISICFGERHRSNLLQSISLKPYDKTIEGTLENRWICSDENIVKAYNNNPKCHYIFTANGFVNLMTLLHNTYQNSYTPNNKDLPILFIAGEQDPVIGSAEKHLASIKQMKNIGYKNIQSNLYKDMRHELLNEKEHLLVMNDILSFIYKNIVSNS